MLVSAPQRQSQAAPQAHAPCPQSQAQRGNVPGTSDSRMGTCMSGTWRGSHRQRGKDSGTQGDFQALAQQRGSGSEPLVSWLPQKIDADSPPQGTSGFLFPSLAGTATLGDVLPHKDLPPFFLSVEHSVETVGGPRLSPGLQPLHFPSTWDATHLPPHPRGTFAEGGHLLASSAFPGVWRARNCTSRGPGGCGALDESRRSCARACLTPKVAGVLVSRVGDRKAGDGTGPSSDACAGASPSLGPSLLPPSCLELSAARVPSSPSVLSPAAPLGVQPLRLPQVLPQKHPQQSAPALRAASWPPQGQVLPAFELSITLSASTETPGQVPLRAWILLVALLHLSLQKPFSSKAPHVSPTPGASS